ncbi:MAG: hypothetical protein FWC01_05840 [Treponema sp.]|nr:hypothetical protein [Treponema sp.]MCL2237386.1 hypothetical protein [Treponema sp.]
MRNFYLINFIALLVVSCQQNLELPETYDIIFINQYFETLDSLIFADNTINNIIVGTEVEFYAIPRGQYSIIIFTHSKLKIEATVSLIGTKKVKIFLTENGILILENY